MALEEALSAGAAAHDLQALLIAELEIAPCPTVLILEDVHWADDATFDAITVLGRRLGSLLALLVLTFRRAQKRFSSWDSRSYAPTELRPLHRLGLIAEDVRDTRKREGPGQALANPEATQAVREPDSVVGCGC